MTGLHDHPLRYQLANELHARPFPRLDVPSRAIFVAIKPEVAAVARDREADRAHLVALLDRHGAVHPQPGATHHFAELGRHQLKWESHTEFVTYTLFLTGAAGRLFDPANIEVFPADWLAEAPGQRMTSVMVEVLPRPDDATLRGRLTEGFLPESLAVSRVLDDAAVMAGDFRIDPAGHQRFAVFVSPQTGAQRVGRIVQRVCEIETYKAISMLGFARARSLAPRMNAIDAELSNLVEDMASGTGGAEETLQGLLRVAGELEALSAQTAFRFSATQAYAALVEERIAALREERFEGRQTFAEFMMRRYDPAMRTAQAAERRLSIMGDRATRAGELLRTRVDVDRSAQNQKLLESMDARADTALRLQKTVEGLSVVAISYYAVSLLAYMAAPLAARAGVEKSTLVALVTPLVVLAVWGVVRRIRLKLH